MERLFDFDEEKKIKAKHRLIGAAILILFIVIIIPSIFDSEPRQNIIQDKNYLNQKQKQMDNLITLESNQILNEDNLQNIEITNEQNNEDIIQGFLNDINKNEIDNEIINQEKIVSINNTQPKINLEENAIPIIKQPVEKIERVERIENVVKVEKIIEPKAETKATIIAEEKKTLNQSSEAVKKIGNQNKFVVQLGSFSELTKAEKLRDKLKEVNINSFIQNIDTVNGKYSRVRTGPFNSKEDAKHEEVRLKLLGFTTATIMPN